MTEILLDENDVEQIRSRNTSPESVISQIEIFRNGFPSLYLDRPSTPSDGIKIIAHSELRRLTSVYSEALKSTRPIKFVPASGAATRMFKLLISSLRKAEVEPERTNEETLISFIEKLKNFAFYDDLKAAMAEDALDIETLVLKRHYREILEYLLTARGLNYADYPKGLIKFHRYPEGSRTPFEEHLVEAAAYTRDGDGMSRVHFTVPAEHEKAVRKHVEEVKHNYEVNGIRFAVSFSLQNPATDTIAVDLDNKPFRDRDGRLVFRPAGHGALLENLNGLGADIVFIKNIDNVVPDRLKDQTFFYKMALGGYLVELQREIFGYLERLVRREFDERLLENTFEFARHELSVFPSKAIERGTTEEKVNFLISKLNRPVRVCGVVNNEGEPGGGPFWVRGEDNTSSLQIVESSQVDAASPGQRAIWESSTHFNPVDLVCAIKDYTGKPFDLNKFVDPNTGFISIKSVEGKDIKALELPGLWNGAMANWNTIFVEIPLITFNPVKSAFDLLREEHQPS